MVVNGNCIAIFQGALGASGEQYGIDAKGEHIPHGGGVAGPLKWVVAMTERMPV